jgi:hypothetical protein
MATKESKQILQGIYRERTRYMKMACRGEMGRWPSFSIRWASTTIVVQCIAGLSGWIRGDVMKK